MTGGNGDDLDAARLWPAPASGAAAISKGTFVDFNLDVTAQFASPATRNTTTGWYENNTMPTSVTGTLSGIFLNNSTDVPSNGYYRFNYTVTGPGSWAAQNNATWNDGDYAPISEWAAPRAAEPATVAAVPGPGKLALLGLSLVLGLTMAARRGGRRVS